MHQILLSTRRFGVNILSAGQEQSARYFAGRDRPQGVEQFRQVDWFPGKRLDVPLLVGSLAWMECEVTEVYDAGDHSIFLGAVLDAVRNPGEALLSFGGGFHQGMPAPRGG